jgi:hypothetical protein
MCVRLCLCACVCVCVCQKDKTAATHLADVDEVGPALVVEHVVLAEVRMHEAAVVVETDHACHHRRVALVPLRERQLRVLMQSGPGESCAWCEDYKHKR